MLLCNLYVKVTTFVLSFFCEFYEFSLAIGPMPQISVLALNFSQATEQTSFYLEAYLLDVS